MSESLSAAGAGFDSYEERSNTEASSPRALIPSFV